MAVTTAKMVEVLFENALETYESQTMLLNMCDFIEPDGAMMQNTGNIIWRTLDQHAPIISGWDLTGEETGIIDLAYPAYLGTPDNDFVRVRADDLRDKHFWEKRGKAAGRRQASNLNSDIASAITLQGALFYRSNATDGFDFIGEAQAMMNERQLANNGRYFVINDRDQLTFATDLASRQTIKGRPSDAWATGQIGSQVAQFDLFDGSFLPNLTGGADPAVTCTGDHTFAPRAGTSTVSIGSGVVTNYDCRLASIIVNNSALLTVGDKITIENTGVSIKALGLDDKTNTAQAMIFSVVELTDATHIQVYPRPIAADDAALSTVEKSYANVDTVILDAATITRLNTDATKRANIFWDKEAVEVMGGTIPADLFQEFSGKKVIHQKMSNGLTMYFVYDGDIATMNFRYRLFTWFGITIRRPEACGVAVTY